MKKGVFFCDIIGTLTNDIKWNDINESQVELLMKHLEEIRETDNLDEMYFSLISSDHMKYIVDFFNKKIRPIIEKSTIKIGPIFSSTHFKEMGEYENFSDDKGTICENGKSIQIYEAILNKINLQEQFDPKDIKKVYFADDNLLNQKLTNIIITRKIPNIILERFILGKKTIGLNSAYITEGVGINSFNALLSKYVKDKSKRVDSKIEER